MKQLSRYSLVAIEQCSSYLVIVTGGALVKRIMKLLTVGLLAFFWMFAIGQYLRSTDGVTKIQFNLIILPLIYSNYWLIKFMTF